jgi:hypothetical protein
MTCPNRLARGEKMSMQRISRDVLAEKYAKGDDTTAAGHGELSGGR